MLVLFNESSYSETKILVQRRVIVMMLLFLGLSSRKCFSFFKRKYVLILQFCIFDFIQTLYFILISNIQVLSFTYHVDFISAALFSNSKKKNLAFL